VEARYRAAGNADEKEREDRRQIAGGAIERGRDDHWRADQNRKVKAVLAEPGAGLAVDQPILEFEENA